MLENENGDATGVGDDNKLADEAVRDNAKDTNSTQKAENAENAENAQDTGGADDDKATQAAAARAKTTRTRRRAASRPAGPPPELTEPRPEPGTGSTAPASAAPASAQGSEPESEPTTAAAGPVTVPVATFQPPTVVVFQPPEVPPPARRTEAEADTDTTGDGTDGTDVDDEVDEGGDRPSRRRRRRGGRGRGRSKDADGGESAESGEAGEAAEFDGETGRSDDGAEKTEKTEKAEKAEKAGQKTAEKDRRKDKGKEKDDRGKGRGKGKDEAAQAAGEEAGRTGDTGEADEYADDEQDDGQGAAGTRRRRRRRRRGGGADGEESSTDDPPNTVVHVREPRAVEDEVQSVKGSTRLEAKKQRRREGREQGRRRPPIITESEFLARREAVERVMAVRREGERTQIAVLEDGVLVEHYVDRASHQSYVGNVYLGKVQNVLPSMEAAFVDIGKGRNAVLYAGEVNWDNVGLEGQPRRIESALKSGQSVLVQVTKDPLGHKGARLTSQISLPGRYLVYVPDGSMTGISRKLPDKERNRLKGILKKVMPENAGVIVRTAAEGATEEELSRDVSRLSAQWENIQRQAKSASAPALLYGEPDLTIRVVRDVFNEDFTKLAVSGDESWDMVAEYIEYVAPHLAERTTKWTGKQDIFEAYRIDEQIAKALERKVWLPSGGSLVIDRTEAMTVIDVNTGKFTGQGGNLEETVTRNNLEAAEEIVRQLRLRDIGGIIVIDFIDMVLESNRDLVLRRLVECLARDRTKHQVAEVTSLGLVQMTRKRVGQGLLEAFSEVCECCNGRGIHVSVTPVDEKPEKAATGSRRRKRKGEVERAVERKLARQEAAKERMAEAAQAAQVVQAASAAETADVAETAEAEAVEAAHGTGAPGAAEESAEQAVEDAAEIAAEVTETGPPQLESVEPVAPVDLDDEDSDDDEDDDVDVDEAEDVDEDDEDDEDSDDEDDDDDADVVGPNYAYDLDEEYEPYDVDEVNDIDDEPVGNGRRRPPQRTTPNVS
ncbi:MAG TPA: Rne/Rng family ribonuclease [Streptosporangiaceae bacterium]|nr:Rne/Rng family ribonuclease [Streptosporangiaceae bacterium]